MIPLGVSTGGPRTLEDILPELPEDFPRPVVVAQHMPGAFTGSFAARLDKICALNVLEVSSPLPLKRRQICIGRGNADLVVDTRLDRPIINSIGEDSQYLWHPSVDANLRGKHSSIAAQSQVSRHRAARRRHRSPCQRLRRGGRHPRRSGKTGDGGRVARSCGTVPRSSLPGVRCARSHQTDRLSP